MLSSWSEPRLPAVEEVAPWHIERSRAGTLSRAPEDRPPSPSLLAQFRHASGKSPSQMIWSDGFGHTGRPPLTGLPRALRDMTPFLMSPTPARHIHSLPEAGRLSSWDITFGSLPPPQNEKAKSKNSVNVQMLRDGLRQYQETGAWKERGLDGMRAQLSFRHARGLDVLQYSKSAAGAKRGESGEQWDRKEEDLTTEQVIQKKLKEQARLLALEEKLKKCVGVVKEFEFFAQHEARLSGFIRYLVSASNVITEVEGQVAFRRGDPLGNCYVVLSGKIEVNGIPEGEEQRLDEAGSRKKGSQKLRARGVTPPHHYNPSEYKTKTQLEGDRMSSPGRRKIGNQRFRTTEGHHTFSADSILGDGPVSLRGVGSVLNWQMLDTDSAKPKKKKAAMKKMPTRPLLNLSAEDAARVAEQQAALAAQKEEQERLAVDKEFEAAFSKQLPVARQTSKGDSPAAAIEDKFWPISVRYVEQTELLVIKQADFIEVLTSLNGATAFFNLHIEGVSGIMPHPATLFDRIKVEKGHRFLTEGIECIEPAIYVVHKGTVEFRRCRRARECPNWLLSLKPLADAPSPFLPPDTDAMAAASHQQEEPHEALGKRKKKEKLLPAIAAAKAAVEQREKLRVAEIMSWLLKVSLFKDLPVEEHPALANACATASFADQQVVLRQGEQGSEFFVIQKGEANVYVSKDGGPQVKVATLKPGDFFGERALLANEPRAATIVSCCRPALVCLKITREKFFAQGLPVKLGLVKTESRKAVQRLLSRTNTGTLGTAIGLNEEGFLEGVVEETFETMGPGSVFASISSFPLFGPEPFTVISASEECEVFCAVGSKVKHVPMDFLKLVRPTLAKKLASRLDKVRENDSPRAETPQEDMKKLNPLLAAAQIPQALKGSIAPRAPALSTGDSWGTFSYDSGGTASGETSATAGQTEFLRSTSFART